VRVIQPSGDAVAKHQPKTKPAKKPKTKSKPKAQDRQGILRKEANILCMKSGGICAFPGCGKSLSAPGSTLDDPVIVGQIAHIVADSPGGPRGQSSMSEQERDKHTNLILLCGEHHKVVDSQKLTYSVPVLRQMKADHEERIRRSVDRQAEPAEPVFRTDTVHSSLLPVTHLPQAVFIAECPFGERQEREVWERIRYPEGRNELLPFLLRGGALIAFHDLRQTENPFANVIDHRSVRLLRAEEMWAEAEGMRRYVDLLNRAMNRHAARLCLQFDRDHKRFHFVADGLGQETRVTYRPLAASTATRKTVWQPTRKKDGQKKPFWWHLAVGLRFHHLGGRQWCLSIRPERHLTTDGVNPLAADQVGPKVTRLKARMFNEAYLSEVNFWKEYLADGEPRVILNFGRQSAVIEARLLTFDVHWPGIPGDEKTYSNQCQEDDLFTLVGLRDLDEGEEIDWADFERSSDDDHGIE